MKRIAAVAGLKPLYPSSDPVVETVLHERADGGRLLFVANPSLESRKMKIQTGERETLIDLDTGREAPGPIVEIEIAERTVKIFSIIV